MVLLSAACQNFGVGDVLNVPQADERNRGVTRREIYLFDRDAFREAIINAFVHNRWVDGNAPMITVYSDRIEILSRGTLAPNQTKQGFYLGESVPVNVRLSDIFLQLHISERSGRGVPKLYRFTEKALLSLEITRSLLRSHFVLFWRMLVNRLVNMLFI